MGKVFKVISLSSVLLWTVCVKAEEKAPPPLSNNVDTRMVHLQYAEPHRISGLLPPSSVQVRFDDLLKVIVLSGPPSDLASMANTVRELDSEMAKIPNTNVELTAYVVQASSDVIENAQIPSGLQSTIEQLKTVFPYRSYQLLEAVVVRGSIGDTGFSSGSLPSFQKMKEPSVGSPTYFLKFRLTGITNLASKSTVHIQDLRFETKFVDSHQSQEAGVETNLDTVTGQKVVVGKAGVGGSSLFLVVECKVVQ